MTLVLLVSACSVAAPPSAAPAALGALKIGILVPFTESAIDSDIGASQRRAADLYLKLKGGSFLQLGDPNVTKNFSAGGTYAKGPPPYVSDLWVTTAQAWGATGTTSWGDSMWNTGPISGIFG